MSAFTAGDVEINSELRESSSWRSARMFSKVSPEFRVSCSIAFCTCPSAECPTISRVENVRAAITRMRESRNFIRRRSLPEVVARLRSKSNVGTKRP